MRRMKRLTCCSRTTMKFRVMMTPSVADYLTIAHLVVIIAVPLTCLLFYSL